MFIKKIQNNTIYFFNGDTSTCSYGKMSSLVAVENDSGLLLALASHNDSAPIAEQTMLNGTLLDLSGF